eukprot:4709793-Karenia_brevis.AAC.1
MMMMMMMMMMMRMMMLMMSTLGADWEDLWDRLDALAFRGLVAEASKVKAYTSDTNVATHG